MYRLSQIIPVRMSSHYGAGQKATWVQYRGRIFAHRVTTA